LIPSIVSCYCLVAVSTTLAQALVNPTFHDGMNGWTAVETLDDSPAFGGSSASGGYLWLSSMGTTETVFQTFHGTQGMELTGSAYYETRCYYTLPFPPEGIHGIGSVEINGHNIWRADNTTIPPAIIEPWEMPGQILRTSGWQTWTYTLPADGDYTIAFDLRDGCQYGASARFNGVTVHVPTISDTGETVWLLGCALACVAGVYYLDSKNPKKKDSNR